MTSPIGPIWLVRALALALVGGWFGAFSLFSLVIAPTAFQVLPSQAAAGALVSPVLGVLHNYGILAGISLTALGALMRQGKVAIVFPVVLTALCAISEYLVTPAITELGPRSFGEDHEVEAARRFSDLHQVSRYLFGIIQFGALGLIVLYSRPGTAARSSETPQSGT